MKAINTICIVCGLLLILLCYADRQQADEKAAERETAAAKQNAQRAARQVEWVDLDKVGRYMTAFDNIERNRK